jgi:hypothetical protein
MNPIEPKKTKETKRTQRNSNEAKGTQRKPKETKGNQEELKKTKGNKRKNRRNKGIKKGKVKKRRKRRMKKLLPIGISDFKKLREGGYVYVDKTEYINRLIKEGSGYYFLSRPRRFGKSLLLSTIRYLFEGQRELFKGLYIEEKWEWGETYPVIRISFAKDIKRKEDLRDRIREEIEKNYERNGEEMEEGKKDEGSLLERLVIKINKKKRKQVVVLIDEYDKPILDVIEDKKEAEEVRKELKGFYSVLKDLDEYIKFVLITGVSKFSKVSLFSGLNQLEDISLSKEYGNICGYTQEELEIYFKEYLEGVNIEEVREWYNGYNFLGEKVYNPFDILLYLKSKVYKNYWYETGKTEFLFKLIKEKEYKLSFLEKEYYTNEILEKFDIEYVGIEALMYQTGYLTIKEVKKIEEEEVYVLDYPNREVRQSFNRELLYYIVGEYQSDRTSKLKIALIEEDMEEIRRQIEIFLETISYDVLKNENVYQASIYGLMYGMGYEVEIEDRTLKGRIDLTLLINRKKVYIMELKLIEKEEEKGKAIRQIEEREYYKKYMNYERVYIVGIEIDKVKKRIVNYEYKRVK